MEPKMISLQCTKCGGKVAFDAEHSTLKCPYCGETALVQEETVVQLKRIEQDHEMRLLEYNENLRAKNNRDATKMVAILWVIIILAFMFLIHTAG